MKRHTLPPKRVEHLRYPHVRARDRYAWLGEVIFWIAVMTWVCITCAIFGRYHHFTEMQRLDRKDNNPAPVIGEATVAGSTPAISTNYPTSGTNFPPNGGVSSGVEAEGFNHCVNHGANQRHAHNGNGRNKGAIPEDKLSEPSPIMAAPSQTSDWPAQSLHIQGKVVKENARPKFGNVERQFNPRALGIQLRMQGKAGDIRGEEFYKRDVRNGTALTNF